MTRRADSPEKVAALGEFIKGLGKYAPYLDDTATAAARLTLKKKDEDELEVKKANLDLALGELYQVFGPGHQKHAAARYYAGLDQEQQAITALGAPFCKLASACDQDPWRMALSVVEAYPSLVKTALALPSIEQELASFYVTWGDEVSKQAAAPEGFVRKLLGKLKGAPAKAPPPEMGNYMRGAVTLGALGLGGTAASDFYSDDPQPQYYGETYA